MSLGPTTGGPAAPPGAGAGPGPTPPGRPRHWSDSPAAIRHLAGAYALGTLSGPARRRFEAVLRHHPQAARAVDHWHRRLQPLGDRLAPLPPSAGLWARIEAQAWPQAQVSPAPSAAAAAVVGTTITAGGASATQAAPAERPESRPAPRPQAGLEAGPEPGLEPRPEPRLTSRPAWRRWLDSLLSPAPAMAIAFSFAVGLMAPQLGLWRPGGPGAGAAGDGATELPESYVGVLATAQGRTGLIVSSLRQGRVLDVKRVVPVAVAPGQQQVLWIIDAQGRSVAVAAVPVGPFVRVPLPQAADPLFASAVELAVSLEPAGALPAQPSAPFVYRGLCGKLWRVPASAPATASVPATTSTASASTPMPTPASAPPR